jgi:hypothetical protein
VTCRIEYSLQTVPNGRGGRNELGVAHGVSRADIQDPVIVAEWLRYDAAAGEGWIAPQRVLIIGAVDVL